LGGNLQKLMVKSGENKGINPLVREVMDYFYKGAIYKTPSSSLMVVQGIF
jgi:hypothetical protein